MRPKDVGYVTLFTKKDLSYIYRLAEEIRLTHNQDLVNQFNRMSENKWNDHNPVLDIGNKRIEPVDVTKSEDLVVTSGVNQVIDQILGASTVRWQFMARGTGIVTPAITDTTLGTEFGIRIDMNLFGWRENASTSLRFAGIYGESVSTGTFTEAGVFTTLTTGIMLNRCMFNNYALSHSQNVTGFVISFIIEFVPVM